LYVCANVCAREDRVGGVTERERERER
jgi:hypothetical protein